MSRSLLSLSVAVVLVAGLTSLAWADEDAGQIFVAADAGASLVTDRETGPFLNNGIGYAGRVGWREGQWGAFLHVGQDAWFTNEVNRRLVAGTLNVAIGGEFHFADGRMSTSFAAGSSTLLFDTLLDNKGITGLFLDLRPITFRWPLGPSLSIALCPLTITRMAPVLGDVPLVRLEYQTVLSAEWQF